MWYKISLKGKNYLSLLQWLTVTHFPSKQRIELEDQFHFLVYEAQWKLKEELATIV